MYVISKQDGEIISLSKDLDLFYYREDEQIMIRTDFTKAEYVLVKGKFYHGDDFFPEPASIKGKYETVHVQKQNVG